MRFTLLLLACAALPAQVAVTVVPMSQATTKAVLNGRMAKRTTVWTVDLENGPDQVSVSPAAVLRRVPQIRPFDPAVMAALIADGQQYSLIERLVRVAGDGSATAGFMGTGKVIPMSNGLNVALAGASWALPYVASRLKGVEPPLASNYNSLAWSTSISLSPGASAITHIFSERWTGVSDPITVTIETAKLPATKSAQ